MTFFANPASASFLCVCTCTPDCQSCSSGSTPSDAPWKLCHLWATRPLGRSTPNPLHPAGSSSSLLLCFIKPFKSSSVADTFSGEKSLAENFRGSPWAAWSHPNTAGAGVSEALPGMWPRAPQGGQQGLGMLRARDPVAAAPSGSLRQQLSEAFVVGVSVLPVISSSCFCFVFKPRGTKT